MAGRAEKFAALRIHLEQKAVEFRDTGQTDYEMKFREIGDLGVRLPPSAYQHHAWWSDRKYERPWTRAKFQPENIDLQNQKLIFRFAGAFSAEIVARQRAKQEKEWRA